MKAAPTPAARRRSTWSFIRAISGETTSVSPPATTAGADQATGAQASGTQASGTQASGGSASRPAQDVVPPAATTPEGPRVQRAARVALQVPNGRFDSVLTDVTTIVEQAGGYISG